MRELRHNFALKKSLSTIVIAAFTCVFAAVLANVSLANPAWAQAACATDSATSAVAASANVTAASDTFDNTQTGQAALSTLATATETLDVTVEGTVMFDEAHKILPLVNQARAKVGADALTWDYSLEQTAIQRAAEISLLFSHTRPNNKLCFTAFTESYSALAENIFMSGWVSSADYANTSWTNSEGHYKNMISTNQTRFAAACFVSAAGKAYWVEVFSNNTTSSTAYLAQGSQARTFTITSTPANLDFTKAAAAITLNAGRTATVSWAPAGTTGVSGVVCESSNTSVATVDATSMKVAAQAPGTATLTLYTATTRTKLAQTTVTVRNCYLFNDVPWGEWYAQPSSDFLQYSVENNLITGYSETQFGPYDSITRAQVAVILWRIAGKPTATAQAFPDVNYSLYYGDAINWARSAGVITGYGNSASAQFRPEAPVTREELCTMLHRYAKMAAGVSATPSASAQSKFAAFPDNANVSSWAKTAMTWAVEQGIITGDTSTGTSRLNPQGTAYRCQAAKMVAVYHQSL
jgi:uncharacterized protein YkwD